MRYFYQDFLETSFYTVRLIAKDNLEGSLTKGQEIEIAKGLLGDSDQLNFEISNSYSNGADFMSSLQKGIVSGMNAVQQVSRNIQRTGVALVNGVTGEETFDMPPDKVEKFYGDYYKKFAGTDISFPTELDIIIFDYRCICGHKISNVSSKGLVKDTFELVRKYSTSVVQSQGSKLNSFLETPPNGYVYPYGQGKLRGTFNLIYKGQVFTDLLIDSVSANYGNLHYFEEFIDPKVSKSGVSIPLYGTLRIKLSPSGYVERSDITYL